MRFPAPRERQIERNQNRWRKGGMKKAEKFRETEEEKNENR